MIQEKEASRIVMESIKKFAVSQYLDLKGPEIENETYRDIRFHLVSVIAEEMLSSIKNQLITENDILAVTDLLEGYMESTNYINEQRQNGVLLKNLDFFRKREVGYFLKSYRMFFYVDFQGFCYKYVSSGFRSPTFEKMLIYDLVCCEYSSFIDEQTTPFWAQFRETKHNPILLFYVKAFFNFINISFSYFFNVFTTYVILALFFDNKDVALLSSFLLNGLFRLNIFFDKKRSMERSMKGMDLVYYTLKDSANLSAERILKFLELAAQKEVKYPAVTYAILDRAKKEDLW